jgi:ferric iron reductase protein FhuF
LLFLPLWSWSSNSIKNSLRTAEKTPNSTITMITWLMLFEEIIAVYSENHTKHIQHIHKKWSVIDCWSRWDK